MFDNLSEEQLKEAERELASKKREMEYARWDKELVGRCVRIIRNPTRNWWGKIVPLASDDYVTLEESLAVGSSTNGYVYADIVYLHIQSREDSTLTCSGFEVSHQNRKEPYLKIQPVFYSYSDFRSYLGSWNDRSGQTKHFDEISKEEYDAALKTAARNFTGVEM